MMVTQQTVPSVAARAWDSDFFGFSVAEVCAEPMNIAAVEQSLRVAKARGVRLVYLRTLPNANVPDALLKRFNGTLVDQKVTYALQLSKADVPVDRHRTTCPTYSVLEHPIGPASPALLQLALTAGVYSRFNVDPRFPTRLFHALYGKWINRSSLHELADAVLVASLDEQAPIGMVTIAVEGNTAVIGLIAVAEEARGQGIGRALLSAAHRWMEARQLVESRVTTQRVNRQACNLYERSGYAIAEAAAIYHFWP